MFIVHIIQQLKLFHHFPKKCSNNLVRATVTCLPPPKLLSWKLVLGLFLLLLIQFHPQNHSLTYNYFYLYLYYFFIVRLGEENNFLDITDLYCYNIANITYDNGKINYSRQLNVRLYYNSKLLLLFLCLLSPEHFVIPLWSCSPQSCWLLFKSLKLWEGEAASVRVWKLNLDKILNSKLQREAKLFFGR